jgi:uncharacterized membrane protein
MEILSIIIFAISMVIIDFFWIKLYILNKYTKFFKSLKLKMIFKLIPAILTYIIMLVAYILFTDNKKSNLHEYLISSSTLGAVLFGVYGFTLASIFPKYNIWFALTETLWGTILYTLSALITYYVYNAIKN